jgi:hypothetical protein
MCHIPQPNGTYANLNPSPNTNFHANHIPNPNPNPNPNLKVYQGNEDGKFYAFDTTDGSIRWNFTTGGHADNTPLLGGDGTIYFGDSEKNFYALNPDGSLLWDFKAQDTIYTPATINSDGTIYFPDNSGWIYAFRGGLPESTLTTTHPTAAPTETPTETPTKTPTETPTKTPTETPTETPTKTPTETPTKTPTETPTKTPSAVPTEVPTELPTETPTTEIPTETPTARPSYDLNTAGQYQANSPWPKLGRIQGNTGYSPVTASQSAELIWNFTSSSTMIANPVVTEGADYNAGFAVSNDGTIYYPTAPYLWAIDPYGQEKWRLSIGQKPHGTNPTLGSDGTIYIAGNGATKTASKLYAVNPDGTEKWSVTLTRYHNLTLSSPYP